MESHNSKCAVCKNFAPDPEPTYSSGIVRAELNDILETRTKCNFCRFLHDVVQHLSEPSTEWSVRIESEKYPNRLRKTRLFVDRPGLHPEQARRAFIGIFGIDDREVCLGPGVQVKPSNDDTKSLFKQEKPNPHGFVTIEHCPSGYTGSKKALKTIQKCISRCATKHALCGMGNTAAMPSRILAVASDPDAIFLQDSPVDPAHYACLSYCWGSPHQLRTTRQSLKSHQNGILISELPRTFRDAVSVARSLNLKYLWIDSLCILQDDRDDWRAEAGKMSQYYGNAYVTLAATKSANADSGLFVSNQVSTAWNSPEGIQYLLARRMGDLMAMGYPLFRRGWIFQERLLSPRVIHFADEFYFECYEDNLRESVSFDAKHVSWVIKQRFSDATATHTSAGHNPSYPQFDSEETWHEIVEVYSSLHLTNPCDILPALSGIADRFQARKGTKYIAGLWEDTLISDLIWYNCGMKPPSLSSWRAPSWSWASINCPVSYYDVRSGSSEKHLSITTSVILSSDCTLAGPSATGEVLNGFLGISGNLEFHETLDSAWSKHKVQGDWGANHPDRSFWDLEDGVELIPEKYRADRPVSILWLGSRFLYGGERKEDFGLLLTKKAENIYERIGLVVSESLLNEGPGGELATVKIE